MCQHAQEPVAGHFLLCIVKDLLSHIFQGVLHCLQPGDILYTASMKPIMTFLDQSGPGVHDTTAAACSYGLYVLQLGEVSHSQQTTVLRVMVCAMHAQRSSATRALR